MPDELTAAQREVLQTISDYIKKEGLPPTLRELGDLLGIRSTNGVRDHLVALTKKGYVKPPTKWKQARGIVLTDKAIGNCARLLLIDALVEAESFIKTDPDVK